MSRLTHMDESGRPVMVDVSGKAHTTRVAAAAGLVRMKPETKALAVSGEAKKGDVRAVAEIAGIMAAKKTSELIPLCHPLAISQVEVRVEPVEEGLAVAARVRTTGQTGVEMEALTATSVALLTIYDMCKAVDRGMRIGDIRLLEKAGGKSGHWTAD